MTNKRKAYESSAMGKLANLGSTINKMVGREESESEPESDVSLKASRCIVVASTGGGASFCAPHYHPRPAAARLRIALVFQFLTFSLALLPSRTNSTS